MEAKGQEQLLKRQMKILNKEFILGSAIYIALYVIIATVMLLDSVPAFIRVFEYGLGQDFFLVLAPLIVIVLIMGLGAVLFLLHQLFVVIGMVVLDTLGHFKRK